MSSRNQHNSLRVNPNLLDLPDCHQDGPRAICKSRYSQRCASVALVGPLNWCSTIKPVMGSPPDERARQNRVTHGLNVSMLLSHFGML